MGLRKKCFLSISLPGSESWKFNIKILEGDHHINIQKTEMDALSRARLVNLDVLDRKPDLVQL